MFLKYFAGDGVLNDIKRILGYWKLKMRLPFPAALHEARGAGRVS